MKNFQFAIYLLFLGLTLFNAVLSENIFDFYVACMAWSTALYFLVVEKVNYWKIFEEPYLNKNLAFKVQIAALFILAFGLVQYLFFTY